MWDKEIIDLGRVKAKKAYTIVYNYTGDKIIKGVITSCGCGVASYVKTNTGYALTITYTAKGNHKDYKKNGTVTVTFTDNIINKLKFKSDVDTGD